MSDLFFEIDLFAFFLTCLFIIALAAVYRWRQAFSLPHLFFSSIKDLQIASQPWRVRLAKLPTLLTLISLGCFLLAFIDPHFYVPRQGGNRQQMPDEGIAIYLVADRSGSMSAKVDTVTHTGRPFSIVKMDLLKQLTAQFVQGNPKLGLAGRPNDLIGLISFARIPYVIVPLTLDHDLILEKLSKLETVKDPSQDGTAIGYAIFKAVNVIAATRHYTSDLVGSDRPAYDIKSAVIVLITDGFHAPHPGDEGNPLRSIDPAEAAQYAADHKVRVYLINIEPALGSEEFAPHRHLMQRIAEQTGGKYYLMDSATSLEQIYVDIDNLEKSFLPPRADLSKDQQPHLFQRVSLYPYLIGAAMLLLLLSASLRTTLFRKVP